MSLSVAVIDALLGAGATREQLAAAIKADIVERDAEQVAKLEAKRSSNRTRQQRKRAKDNAPSRDVTPVTRDKCDNPPKVSPKNNIQTPSSPPVDVSEAVASSHHPRPWALPVGVSLQVWEDLMTNRRKKRLPNTPTAWAKFQSDLAEMCAQTGIPPPELIRQCTAKGWGAIYDPREERNGQQRTNGMGRHQSADGLSPTTRAAVSVFGAPSAREQRRLPR